MAAGAAHRMNCGAVKPEKGLTASRAFQVFFDHGAFSFLCVLKSTKSLVEFFLFVLAILCNDFLEVIINVSPSEISNDEYLGL